MGTEKGAVTKGEAEHARAGSVHAHASLAHLDASLARALKLKDPSARAYSDAGRCRFD